MKTLARPDPRAKVVLDHRIKVAKSAVPPAVLEAMQEALVIPNLEKQNALKHFDPAAEFMPDELVMYDDRLGVMEMPRGFLGDFKDGMAAFGIKLDILDHRIRPRRLKLGNKINLRTHQVPAVDAILENKEGIYKAPPGSGKTVTVLEAGKRAATQCLVIVNTKDIAKQWIARIKQHLHPKINVSMIGDGIFQIGKYWTVAIVQTLHSRYEQLEEEGFFDLFGFVCLDECHHATAETYLRVMNRFTALWRFGVSATPKKTGDFALAELVLGPIFHETKLTDIPDLLVKPTIIRVKTSFKFNFKGTRSRWQRSNYPKLLAELIVDRERNQAIVDAIMHEQGHHCLAITKRHEHIDIIEAMLYEAGYEYPIMRLTGKESTEERERVIQAIAEAPGLLLSTLADEALDVPRIDRGFLIFPQNNEGLIEQQLGRFMRAHKDKISSRVYDFADLLVPPLRNQWNNRKIKVYKRFGLEIRYLTVEGFDHE